ncbi:MAG TPA: hypothetical protein PK907_03740 [Candidatus Sabulitectum sp.]|nr:hypothetical protein [Candidatus Sabulitectum sp.]
MISLSAYADVLLEDDFSDGNADGWRETEYGQCNYEVKEGEYWINGMDDSWGLSTTGDSSGTMSVPDYSLVLRVEPEYCGYAGPVVRYAGVNNYFACLLIMPQSNMVYLADLNLSSGSHVLDYCSFTIDPEESYWMRLEVEGTQFRGRVWTGTPGDEPTEWMVSGTDNWVSDTGGIGIYCWSVSPVDEPLKSLSVYFDDVQVTGDLAGAMEPVTWGGLKVVLSD